MKLSENPDVPTLEGGWMNLTEAAEALGISRQHAYRQASKGEYSTLRRVGKSPTFVMNVSEVDDLLSARADRKAAQEEPVAQ